MKYVVCVHEPDADPGFQGEFVVNATDRHVAREMGLEAAKTAWKAAGPGPLKVWDVRPIREVES